MANRIFFGDNLSSVIGTVRSVGQGTNIFGSKVALIEGTWDGQQASTLETVNRVVDELYALGVVGEDQNGQWVDESKRVFIAKHGKGQGNVTYEVRLADPGETARRGQPARQQSQRPQSSRPASAPPSAATQQPAQQPAQRESPEVVRRRIDATYADCLVRAYAIWSSDQVRGCGLELTDATLQAAAATLMIESRHAGVPYLPDPKAGPVVTQQQIAELKALKEAATKVGCLDGFGAILAKHGMRLDAIPPKTSQESAAKAIDEGLDYVRKEEEAVLSRQQAPADDEPIPF